MDTEWSRLAEGWQRVQWARRRAEFSTARAAAESLGMGENTYSAYEREPTASKSTRLNDQRAIQFGKKFKVSWRWLLLREGSPFDKTTPAQERVVAAMSRADEGEQDRIAAVVEAMMKRTGTEG